MGKLTVLQGENQTLSTGSVLLALQTAAAGANNARGIFIKRLEIGQSGTTTLAMIRGEVATRNTSGTLTTTAAAPVTIRPAGGGASGLAGNTSVLGGTGRSGITSSADSGGTYVTLFPFAFANTAGYLYKPAPDEEILVPSSTVLVVRFVTAPGTLTGWTFALTLDEN
jgi:hypothetical protein